MPDLPQRHGQGRQASTCPPTKSLIKGGKRGTVDHRARQEREQLDLQTVGPYRKSPTCRRPRKKPRCRCRRRNWLSSACGSTREPFPAESAIDNRQIVDLDTLPSGVFPVRAIAISPDKSTVAASRGNQIHIYEGAKGEFVRSLVRQRPESEGGQTGQGGAHLPRRVIGLFSRRQISGQRQLPRNLDLGRQVGRIA